MLNRLNMSTSLLALSFSFAVLSPLDMAMGMTPAEIDTLEQGAETNTSTARLLAEKAYDKKDYKRALYYAKLSPNDLVPAAPLILAQMHEEGIEVPKDLQAAYKLYQQVTETSDKIEQEKACFHVARMLYKGTGVQQDLKEAYEIFQELANNRNSLLQGIAQRYSNEILNDRREECRPAYEEPKSPTQLQAIAKDNFNPFQAKAARDLDELFEDKYLDFVEAREFYKQLVKDEDTSSYASLERDARYKYYRPAAQKFLHIAHSSYVDDGGRTILNEESHPCAGRAFLYLAEMCRQNHMFDYLNREALSIYTHVAEGGDSIFRKKTLEERGQKGRPAKEQDPRAHERAKVLLANADWENENPKTIGFSYNSLDKIARDRNNPCAYQASLKALELFEKHPNQFGNINKPLYESTLYKRYEQLLGFEEISNEPLSDRYLCTTAKMLYTGAGVPQDVNEAVKRFQKIAANKESRWQKEAAFKLAMIDYDLKNYDSAYQAFKTISEAEGYYKTTALEKLDKMQVHGWGCPRLSREASNELLAQSTGIYARYKMAGKYMIGDKGIEKDLGIARGLFKEIHISSFDSSAEGIDQGEIYFKLGILSQMKLEKIKKDPYLRQNIKLLTKSKEKTVSTLKQAAQKGSHKASWELAKEALNGATEDAYLKHPSNPLNKGEPEGWFRQNAGESYFKYCYGISASKEMKEYERTEYTTFDYFVHALNGGIPEAWFDRGVSHLHGNGLSKNLDLAFYSFSKFFVEQSKYSPDQRCKKLPEFLKKWMLVKELLPEPEVNPSIPEPKDNQQPKGPTPTQRTMMLQLLLMGLPEGKQTLQ